MKKEVNMKKFLVMLSALCVISSAAIAAPAPTPAPQKIAVIDIQKVVSASPQVKALKKEQEANNKEIEAFVKKAQNDINKQTNEAKKKSLTESYQKQLNSKKEVSKKEYAAKLKAADASITAQISKKATELGYTMVLPKSSVVFGGDDITDAVLKVIK